MEEIDKETIKAVCNTLIVPPYIDTLPSCPIDIIEATDIPGQSLSLKELREVRKMQRQDPLIEKWRRAVIDGVIPRNVWDNQDLTKKQFKSLKMKRGLLFRVICEDEKDVEQLVVPMNYRNDILKGLHNDVGHPGKERTLRLLRERFYWPGMSSSVDAWKTDCNRCIRRKSSTNRRAPLVNVSTTYPLELVCFDYLTLEPSKGGIANILIITDHFTKYAMAIPTWNQTAKTTAEAFYDNFIVNYGIPSRLHSDQGLNYESDIIKELCRLTNMKTTHTTPYHLQGNAGPERFSRTLLDMLGTLEPEQKQDWKKYVRSLVYFYNCTPHESTRFSPFELMFGRKPRLPIDIEFEKITEDGHTKSTKDYISELRDRIERTKKIVESHVGKAKEKQKKYYDKKVRGVQLSIGDHVLVKEVAFDGKHKIADKFEEEPYLIIDQPRLEMPGFKVKAIRSGTTRTLHRHLLLKIEGQEIAEEIKADEIKKEEEFRPEDTKDHDVMEEKESEDEGDGNVISTFLHGDAHNSISSSKYVKTDDAAQKIILTEEEEYGEEEIAEKTEDLEEPGVQVEEEIDESSVEKEELT